MPYKTSTGLVLMLDALGVRNFTIDEAKRFLSFRDTQLERYGNAGFSISDNDHTDTEENATELSTNWSTFGDTIIFSCETESPWEILPAIAFWLNGVINTSIRHSFLFRGALATGEYIIDEKTNTILGPAVADAAQWYESADWSGVVFTPTNIPMLDAVCANHDYDKIWPNYVKYDVPLNTGERLKLWALSWPYLYLSISVSQPAAKPYFMICDLFRKFKILPKGSESKLINTLDFFKWYERKHQERLNMIKNIGGKIAPAVMPS